MTIQTIESIATGLSAIVAGSITAAALAWLFI